MNERDVRRAMQEYAASTGTEWEIPAAVVAVALDELGADTPIGEVRERFIGEFDRLRDVAQAFARQSFPPPGPDGSPGVDFDGWPFVHIDWEAAARTLGASLQTGTLLVVDGRYYFDAV